VNAGQEIQACHSLPADKRIVIETISILGEAGMSPEDKWLAHFTAPSGGQTAAVHLMLPRVFHQFGPNNTQDLFAVTQPVSLHLDPGAQLCATVNRPIGFTSGAAFFSLSGYQTTISP
jgi:hypothetical protein